MLIGLKIFAILWLTEKTEKLIFEDNEVSQIAKWAHLKLLYRLQSERLIKFSDLNEFYTAPKPIERQRISTYLKIFSDKIYNELLSQSRINADKNGVVFINKVYIW